MSNFNIKTPLSHILSSKNLKAVEETKLLTSWKEPTEDQARARDIFLALISFQKSDLFDLFKGHSFWNHWQSKASNFKHGAVWYACSHAQDPLWVKKIIDGVDVKPSLEELLAISCGAVKTPSMLLSVIEWAEQENKHPDIQQFFLHSKAVITLAERGSSSALKSLIKKGYLPFRIQGVEQAVCQRGTHKSHYPRKEVLSQLWEKWGHPTDDQFGELLVATLDKSRKRFNSDFEDFILSFHNPLSPSWNSQHDEALLLTFIPKRMKYIEDLLNQGWVVQDQVWEKVLTYKKQHRQINPTIEALCLKWQILYQLPSALPSPSPRRKL